VRVGAREGHESQHGHGLVTLSWVAGRSSRVSERKTTQMAEERPQPPGKDKAARISTESVETHGSLPFKSGVLPQT